MARVVDRRPIQAESLRTFERQYDVGVAKRTTVLHAEGCAMWSAWFYCASRDSAWQRTKQDGASQHVRPHPNSEC